MIVEGLAHVARESPQPLPHKVHLGRIGFFDDYGAFGQDDPAPVRDHVSAGFSGLLNLLVGWLSHGHRPP